jgi:hypothetical protein
VIGEGLVRLVQGTAAVSAIAAVGGFFVQLPKDASLPAWTWLVVSDNPITTLTTVRGCSRMRLQIDCYGSTGASVIALASAISAVLDGFCGTLTDSDATFVSSCLPSDSMDVFDPERRSFRRMIEYEVMYS